MKRILMAVMAAAVLVTFSVPSFAMDEMKKDKKKEGKVELFGEKKKEEKKGGHVLNFGEEKKKKEGGKLFDEEKKDKKKGK